MSSPDIAYFRSRYTAMDEEELASLSAQVTRDPEQLTEVAREALGQVISERGINVAALLSEKAKSRVVSLQVAQDARNLAADKRRSRTRIFGKVLGVAGLLASAVILIPSVSQAHIGGVVAAIATGGCSIWLIFRYQGD